LLLGDQDDLSLPGARIGFVPGKGLGSRN
jgi:hypothetical protein